MSRERSASGLKGLFLETSELPQGRLAVDMTVHTLGDKAHDVVKEECLIRF
jgi:hypothetical protein